LELPVVEALSETSPLMMNLFNYSGEMTMPMTFKHCLKLLTGRPMDFSLVRSPPVIIYC